MVWIIKREKGFALITLRHLEKSYERKVLYDVNLTFQQGNIYVLKGISGSGKTTLLQILGLMDHHFEGEYLFDDINILTASQAQVEHIREQIGYMHQDSLLLQELTVYENLRLFHSSEENIMKYLTYVNLVEKAHCYLAQLSNGERQRISLIRALLKGGKIIICDEPSASLDDETSSSIALLFASLKSLGYCFIIATHENCFDEVCDALILLENGKCHVDKQAGNTHHKIEKLEIKDQNFYKADFHYACRRNKKKRKLFTVLITMFLCILFTACSCLLHFKQSYTEKVKQEYPYTTFVITKEYLEKKMKKIPRDKLKIYERYELLQDDVLYTMYAPYEDSTLRIPDVILYGEFPTSSNEVLVNKFYAKTLAKDKEISSILGDEIHVANCSKTYKIKGIVNEDEIGDMPYYEKALNVATVFLAYDDMKHFIPKVDSEYLFASIDADDKELLQYIVENTGLLKSWDDVINERLSYVNLISSVVVVMSCIICFIAFLFLYQFISLELYYRRKEVGYLRLFGMSKNRIRNILYTHYLVQICIPLILATIIYYIGITCFSLQKGIYIALKAYEMLGIWMMILIYTCLLLSLPIFKLLKVEIKELINS